MLKPTIAVTAMLAIVGCSAVYAQQRFGERDGFGRWSRHAELRYRPSADDLAAFTDARIAALKAGLQLTPDQAKNWPAFEQALREVAQLRNARFEGRQAYRRHADTPQQEQPRANPFDRLQRRADNLAKLSAGLKRLADAGAPLYANLTDAQKQRFRLLARILRPHHHMLAFSERGDRGAGWFGRNGPGFAPEHHRSAPDGADTGNPSSQL